MVDKNKEIKITENLCLLAVLTKGEFNGVGFEVYPNILPTFANGIDLEGYNIFYNVDLLKVETSDRGLVCWFSDENDETFFLPLHDLITYNPMLYSAIITNIIDGINGK